MKPKSMINLFKFFSLAEYFKEFLEYSPTPIYTTIVVGHSMDERPYTMSPKGPHARAAFDR